MYTENTLIHYGVKGMKWGKHLFGADENMYLKSPTSAPGNPQSATYRIRTAVNNQNAAKPSPAKAPYRIATPSTSTPTTSSVKKPDSKLMTSDQIKAINERNTAAAKANKTEEATQEKETKKSGKKGSSKKSEKASKEVSDVDIIKKALGKSFDDVQKRTQDYLNKSGKTTLDGEDLKAILGDDFERVRKSVKSQVEARDKQKTEKTSKSKSDSSETKETDESSKETTSKSKKSETEKTVDKSKQQKVEQLQKEYDKAKEYEKKLSELEDSSWKVSGSGEKGNEDHRVAMARLQNAVKDSEEKKKQLDKAKEELKHGYNEDYLVHHGILGQKWGVRRYQNADGSLTSEGKAHYGIKGERKSSSDSNITEKKGFDKDKATKFALAAVGSLAVASAAVYVAKHPEAAKALQDAAYNVGKAMGETGYKATKAIGESSAKLAKAEATAIKRAGKNIVKSYIDSANTMALAAVGAYAIKKIDEHYEQVPKSNNKVVDKVTEIQKESLKSAVKSGTTYNGNGYSVKTGGTVGKDVSAKLGPPKSHGPVVANNDRRWNDIFKNDSVRSNESLRSTIKELRRQGYDMDQIEAYVYGGMWK